MEMGEFGLQQTPVVTPVHVIQFAKLESLHVKNWVSWRAWRPLSSPELGVSAGDTRLYPVIGMGASAGMATAAE